MAAYVPGFEHDVFVSYAHADDVYLALSKDAGGRPSSWVKLVSWLVEQWLPQELNRGRPSIWIDAQLEENEPLSTELVERARRSATILVFLSRNYLLSPWCRDELNAFLEHVAVRKRAGCVFVVQCEKDLDERRIELGVPEALRDLPGFSFCRHDESKQSIKLGLPEPDKEFHSAVLKLTNRLGAKLNELKGLPSSTAPPPDAPAAVLARVTDDLEGYREEVRQYVEQAGFRVLPEGADYPRDDAAALEKALRADLARCKVFVQLVSDVAPRKYPGRGVSFVGLQLELARQAKLEPLQWCKPGTDLAQVNDEAQRRILQGVSRASSIEELKAAVVDALRQKPQPQPDRSGLPIVFVNCDAVDQAIAEKLRASFVQRRIGCAWPLRQGAPSKVRGHLERNLRLCDGLIFVYGEADPAIVSEQVLQAWQIVSQRERLPAAMAVWDGPPPEKEDLPLALPDFEILNFRNGWRDEDLDRFSGQLRP
jgi:hypothetical protein